MDSVVKLQDTLANADTKVESREVAKYFLDTDVFKLDKREGLQIAFGVSHFDQNYEMTPEPWFGEMKLYHKKWGSAVMNEEDFEGAYFEDIPFRPCTREELGLGPLGYDDPTVKFYPMNEDMVAWYENYWKKLNCVD